MCCFAVEAIPCLGWYSGGTVADSTRCLWCAPEREALLRPTEGGGGVRLGWRALGLVLVQCKGGALQCV